VDYSCFSYRSSVLTPSLQSRYSMHLNIHATVSLLEYTFPDLFNNTESLSNRRFCLRSFRKISSSFRCKIRHDNLNELHTKLCVCQDLFSYLEKPHDWDTILTWPLPCKFYIHYIHPWIRQAGTVFHVLN